MNLKPFGLYLHIPWCVTRCVYCDFNTYVDGDDALKHRYQAALTRDIEQSGAALGHPPLDTIFIGGGTPTTLPPARLVQLVNTVRRSFDLHPQAEITVEANPGTLSAAYLRELRQGGINRLSIGVQSFRDDELAFLSRLHRAEAAGLAVNSARRAGFNNISLDLIFNLPRQTVSEWEFTLREAIKLNPEHLSLYSLIVEPGTPLYRQVDQGLVMEPDDDVAADMYACAIDMLGEAGYIHYEISNWAKDGGEAEGQSPRLAAAHNLIYWRNQPYLGLGAGAYSTVNGERWLTVKRPQSYIDRLAASSGLGGARVKTSIEQIDRPTAMAEQMLLGLRLTREGVGAGEFAARFGVSLTEQFGPAIEYGLQRGLTEWLSTANGPRLRLTRQGRFLANQVMMQFMA